MIRSAVGSWDSWPAVPCPATLQEANPGAFAFLHVLDGLLAYTPCFVCANRFDGEARNVYLTFYDGDLAVKFRHIVCPRCVEVLTEEWIGKALHRDLYGRWRDPEPGESLESLLGPQIAPTANGRPLRGH